MRTILKKKLLKLTPTQFIILVYLSAVVVSTLLLRLPFSTKPEVSLTWMDTIFTATSAVTVTGLTIANTADTFTVFGVFILLLLFQIGGIGIMTLGTFLWLILGRSISLSYRKLIMIDQNRHNLSGLVQLMKLVLYMALIFEALGFIIFSVYFIAAGYYDKWYVAVYHAFFHALSAYTNAGFDIFGNSLADFSHDYFVQLITIILIILGAIGFPVLVELREYLWGKNKNFRFSLYTKVTTYIFFLLLAIGTAGIWLIEHNTFYAGMAWHEKLFYSLFNSVSSRSGGMATMDVTEYSLPTQFLLSVMMFIGASPSSVGGGIRTTTFAIVLLTLFTYALGRQDVRIFRRTIKQEDIIKSFVVFAAATILVVTSIILLDVMEKRHSLMNIIFEVSSAFGTCGLSTGITGDLSDFGKTILMFLMFTGRIGVLSLLFVVKTERRQGNYHYPKEDIIIG